MNCIVNMDKPPSRSSTPSTAPPSVPSSFEGDTLRPYIRKLFETTLKHVEFDKEKTREYGREISQRIKSRMIELNPSGWKFAVIVQISQNLGQGGRADLSTHWAPSDVCIQELWSNEHLMCTCFAFAVKAR